MGILDSIRLLYCLNESGIDKAHDLLTELINDPQHNRVTLEQLFEETDNIIQEAEIKFQKEDEEKKIELSNRKCEIGQQYEKEFKMIENQNVYITQKHILDAIKVYEESPYMRLVSSFHWGYIQGKRAERARRKQVSYE